MIETRYMTCFYQLVDPRDKLPFYVGQTIDPQRRLKDYVNGGPQHSRALNRRLKELAQARLQPIMEELERRACTDTEALQRESHWIDYLSSQGIQLLNKSNGKRGWKQQTVYLPPGLLKWLRVQAPQEEREISEIVVEALEEYQNHHIL